MLLHLIGGVVSKLVFRQSMTLWGRLVMNAAAAWLPPTTTKLTFAALSVDTQPAAPSPWRNITISSIQNVRFIPYHSEDIQYLIFFAAKPFNLGKPSIMKDLMYCVCGFTAHSGNKMAGHLGEKRWEIYIQFYLWINLNCQDGVVAVQLILQKRKLWEPKWTKMKVLWYL